MLIAALCVASPAGAQSVADYYHAAAQAYIDGANADAEQAAVAGLTVDPTDAKLQALLEKIRERNPDDSGGEQEQDDAENQEDGEGEQQEDAQSGEPDPEAEQEGQDEQRQPEGEQRQPEEPSEPNEQRGDAGAEGEQEPQTPQGGGTQSAPFEVEPGEMTQTEAERILRAIESDELELLREVQRRRARPRFVEKDW